MRSARGANTAHQNGLVKKYAARWHGKTPDIIPPQNFFPFFLYAWILLFGLTCHFSRRCSVRNRLHNRDGNVTKNWLVILLINSVQYILIRVIAKAQPTKAEGVPTKIFDSDRFWFKSNQLKSTMNVALFSLFAVNSHCWWLVAQSLLF